MFKLIFLVAALVAVSNCYDFQDSEFNQMILDDIHGSVSQRSKRDTETTSVECEKMNDKRRKDIHCCNGDTIDKAQYEIFTTAKHECVKQIWGDDEEPSYDPFNCDQVKEVRQQAICLAECMSKKKNLIDDKGECKRDALIEHLTTLFKDTEWKVKATEGIVDKCLASFDKTKIEEGKCSPMSMHMIHCMWKEYIRSCPKESQNDRWKCKKIREKLEKGDENYLKKVHFHKFLRHHDHEHHEVEKKE